MINMSVQDKELSYGVIAVVASGAISLILVYFSLSGAGYWLSKAAVFSGVVYFTLCMFAHLRVKPALLVIALGALSKYIPVAYISGEPEVIENGRVISVDVVSGFLGLDEEIRIETSLGVYRVKKDIFAEGDQFIFMTYITPDGLAKRDQICTVSDKCVSI